MCLPTDVHIPLLYLKWFYLDFIAVSIKVPLWQAFQCMYMGCTCVTFSQLFSIYEIANLYDVLEEAVVNISKELGPLESHKANEYTVQYTTTAIQLTAFVVCNKHKSTRVNKGPVKWLHRQQKMLHHCYCYVQQRLWKTSSFKRKSDYWVINDQYQ